MSILPLQDSEATVVVSEEDHLTLILLGPWLLNSGYPRMATRPYDYLHVIVARRMGLTVTDTVDHKDRNVLNSKRDNLRLATQSEQQVNQGMHSNNTSGYKNIHWHVRSKKWHVKVSRNKKLIHVGYFKTIEEAVRQRDAYLTRNGMETVL